MATLTSGNLSFRFSFDGFDDDAWTRCSFGFFWKGQQLVRPELVQNWAKHCEHPAGDFLVDLDIPEPWRLLKFLSKVLETSAAAYWESMEPAITLAIYPDGNFPLLPSHEVVIYESPATRERRESREKLKQEIGKLPDDLFMLMIRMDAYNLVEADCYFDEGLILQMRVTRVELERFVKDLQQEHDQFRKVHRIDEWVPKR